METKLTLSIKKDLIKKAKLYAKEQGISLSGLVESYFRILTAGEEDSELKVSPRLNALKGVLKFKEK